MTQQRLAIIGTIYGLLYMGAEGIGAILLTKIFIENNGKEIAGSFSIILYLLGLSNLLITSLGSIVARVVSKALHRPKLLAQQLTISKPIALYLLIALFFVATLVAYLTLKGSLLYAKTWFFFLLGHIIRLYGLYLTYIVVGYGKLGSDKLYQFFFSLIYFTAATILAMQGGELFEIAFVYFVTSLFLISIPFVWIKSLKASDKFGAGESNIARPSDRHRLQVLKRRMMNQVLAMLTNSGAGFFIVNGDVFVVQYLFGESVVAEYSLYSRLGALITSVAGLASAMYYPPIAAAWGKKHFLAGRRLRNDGLRLTAIMALSMVAGSIIFYPYVIAWTIEGRSEVPGFILYFVLLYALVSVHTVANGMPVLATGEYNFVLLSVINAFTSFAGGFIGGSLIGVAGVPIGAILGSLIPSFLHRKKAIEIFNR